MTLRLIATFLCILAFVCEAGGQSANDVGQSAARGEVSAGDAYRGVYRFDDGHMVAIEYTAEGKELNYVDFTSGRFGALFAETETRFVAGPGMLIREPVEIRVTFEAGALRWQEEGQSARRARRLNLREEEVRFSNGEVELAGTLIRPLGKGPFPAIVLTQTSNDAPRDAYRKEAGFFAAKGFAALVYDKRGVGRSTGDWRRATMRDLAEDASAAVERLRKTEGIDSTRIGIWGQSQGGWIGPLAAAINPRVAFVIAQSAPTVTPAEQEIFRVEHNLRADGFPPEQIEDAVRYQKLLMRWVLEGAGRDELLLAVREAEKAPWAEYVALPADPLPDQPRETTRLFYSYDPRPALRALRCPVLFLFGDRDSFVPVERSLEELRAILSEPGHRDQTIQVLRDTAHGMWETRFDGRKHFLKARRYGDRYWQKLAAWLEAQARRNAAAYR